MQDRLCACRVGLSNTVKSSVRPRVSGATVVCGIRRKASNLFALVSNSLRRGTSSSKRPWRRIFARSASALPVAVVLDATLDYTGFYAPYIYSKLAGLQQ